MARVFFSVILRSSARFYPPVDSGLSMLDRRGTTTPTDGARSGRGGTNSRQSPFEVKLRSLSVLTRFKRRFAGRTNCAPRFFAALTWQKNFRERPSFFSCKESREVIPRTGFQDVLLRNAARTRHRSGRCARKHVRFHTSLTTRTRKPEPRNSLSHVLRANTPMRCRSTSVRVLPVASVIVTS